MLWRSVIPLLLAVATAVVVDLLAARRGMLPPGFRVREPGVPGAELRAGLRRALGSTLLAGALLLGVFQPLAFLGTDLPDVDLTAVPTSQLFLLHTVLAGALVGWYLLGFAGVRDPRDGDPASQLGLRAAAPLQEMGLGVAVGVGAWMVVLLLLVLVSALLYSLGGAGLFPERPPAMVVWIASLPVLVRLAVSLSAGLVEEAFFRGFLQARVGIPLSTALFVLAHLTYEQPLMLVGITVLSLIFAYLVRRRKSIWAAVVAHSTFDAIQLLFLIPMATQLLDNS